MLWNLLGWHGNLSTVSHACNNTPVSSWELARVSVYKDNVFYSMFHAGESWVDSPGECNPHLSPSTGSVGKAFHGNALTPCDKVSSVGSGSLAIEISKTTGPAFSSQDSICLTPLSVLPLLHTFPVQSLRSMARNPWEYSRRGWATWACVQNLVSIWVPIPPHINEVVFVASERGASAVISIWRH